MKSLLTIALLVLSTASFASNELACFGTEPFFNAKITKGFLGFEVMGDGAVVEPVISKINAQGTNEFAYKVKTKNLNASVITGDCNDGMSDRVYRYHILLEKGNKAYYGCCN